MNKKIYLIIVGILIIISGTLIWSYINSDKEVVNNVNEIIPEEEITDKQLRSTNVSLYFLNKDTGEMEIETRRIDAKNLIENPYAQILNLWIAGANNKNLITGCSDELKINKVELEKNCCVIDFDENFICEINNENIDELKVIYCIVNSLTELTEVDSIKILINGEKNVYWGNINLYEEYCRLDI